MLHTQPYFDYNISEHCVTSGQFNTILKLLTEYGYRTVAINQIVEESNLEPKKKKKKGEVREGGDIVPAPIDTKVFKKCSEVKILSRLTIAFSNGDVIHKIIKSANYKKYDVIAVLPLTQNAVQFVANNMEVDIFSFDAESKVPYKMNRKLYNQLVEKKIYFEIPYSPAILDSTKRRNTIYVSHLYHAFGKSKNIIVSSGAMRVLQIRSPYDVINLGPIFGLNEEQAKSSITHNGRQVYINAVGRRHGKAVMFIENIQEKVARKEETATDDEMEVDQPALKKTKQ